MEKERVFPLCRSIIAAVVLFVGIAGASQAFAWSWGNQSLATVNGVEFSADDFRAWWKNWREKGESVPQTPDEFIEWQLMAIEAEKMQLDQEPSFQAKVQTFVKVRALMLLKTEEVDSKVEIPEAEAWAAYKKDFCPRWKIHILFFKDQALADADVVALRDGKVTVAELADQVKKEGGPQFYQSKMVRMPKIDERWREALSGAKPGDVASPIAMHGGYVVLMLDEVIAPDRADFGELREGIETDIRKVKGQELTAALVDRLKGKYGVRVDTEALAAINELPPTAEEGKKVVIATNRRNIDVAQFWAQMEKEKRFREKFKFKGRTLDELKQWILGNIISQTLISWEAMDRHYEEKDPFRQTYQFYRRHRLTREFEKKFVLPKAQVDDADFERYYAKHAAQFTQPEMVSLAMLEGEAGLIEKIWGEITLGRDFFAVAQENFPGATPVRQVPRSHLDSDLRAVIDSLSKGEISKPFAYNGSMALVKFLGIKDKKVVPLADIREQIAKQVEEEKYGQVKKTLLETLKSRSDISVNEREWQRLRKEIEKEDADKKNG